VYLLLPSWVFRQTKQVETRHIFDEILPRMWFRETPWLLGMSKVVSLKKSWLALAACRRLTCC